MGFEIHGYSDNSDPYIDWETTDYLSDVYTIPHDDHYFGLVKNRSSDPVTINSFTLYME